MAAHSRGLHRLSQVAESIEAHFKEKLTMLDEWRSIARTYNCLHTRAHRYYQRMEHLLVWPVIVLSTASGALSLSGTSFVACDKPALNLVVGIMGLATAAVSSVHKLLGYGELAGAHKQSADSFNKLSREIAVGILLADSEQRVYANLGEFIKDCADRFNHIVDMSPAVPSHLLAKSAPASCGSSPRGPLGEGADKPQSPRLTACTTFLAGALGQGAGGRVYQDDRDAIHTRAGVMARLRSGRAGAARRASTNGQGQELAAALAQVRTSRLPRRSSFDLESVVDYPLIAARYSLPAPPAPPEPDNEAPPPPSEPSRSPPAAPGHSQAEPRVQPARLLSGSDG